MFASALAATPMHTLPIDPTQNPFALALYDNNALTSNRGDGSNGTDADGALAALAVLPLPNDQGADAELAPGAAAAAVTAAAAALAPQAAFEQLLQTGTQITLNIILLENNYSNVFFLGCLLSLCQLNTQSCLSLF